MRAKSGFTLVEILIVVVILGILAAIVIPQFTEASTEARESSIMSDLQALRSQIELYKIQHKDNWPERPTKGGTTLENGLTGLTDIAGDVSAGNQGDPGVYGPYMLRMPTNPFNDESAVRKAASDVNNSGDGTTGWFYETSTGKIRPDDSDTHPDGTAHTTY